MNRITKLAATAGLAVGLAAGQGCALFDGEGCGCSSFYKSAKDGVGAKDAPPAAIPAPPPVGVDSPADAGK